MATLALLGHCPLCVPTLLFRASFGSLLLLLLLLLSFLISIWRRLFACVCVCVRERAREGGRRREKENKALPPPSTSSSSNCVGRMRANGCPLLC